MQLNDDRRTNRSDPLGPDSLTWKYFGDLRTGMLGVWIGAIQNMYPELGAGVEEHSVLLREPLQRVARSVYPIMGVVYDGDRAAQTGQQIKGYHETIKGIDAAGRRYHALNPETFYWAHATFFMLIIKIAEYFCGGLTEAEKRQLFDEHVQWYADVRHEHAAGAPARGRSSSEYWDRKSAAKNWRSTSATLDIFSHPHPQTVVRADADSDLGPAVQADGRRDSAGSPRGCSTPRCGRRQACGGRRGDEVLLRLFGKLVEMAFVVVPDEIRLHPRALAAYRRADGTHRPTTLRWSRRPRSCRRRAIAATCRCTTCRRARRCSTAPARWCTPRSRWRACARRAAEARGIRLA